MENLSKENFSEAEIKKFADTVHTPEWIVIGRLLKDGYIKYGFLSRKIPQYTWHKQ